MRVLFVVAAALSLSACQIIYKLPTRQGNVIEQKQLDQLKTGMTREQVHYLMGTPVASSAFRPDRWDYVGYYRSPRGETTQRVVSIFFDGDALTRIEGLETTADTRAIDDPDVKNVLDAQKKAAKEDARAKTDQQSESVINHPAEQQP